MRNLHLKLASRWEDIQSIKSGQFPYPKSLTMFVSEVCNLKCKGCNSKTIHKKNGLMNFNLFKEIVDDFVYHGGQAVSFEGGGEPMMHTQIEYMINYLISKRIRIGMITNGTIFNDILYRLDWLRVSIHGPNDKLYKKMTGVDCLPKVKENLKRLMRCKCGTVGIKFLSSKLCHNPHSYWAGPQVDYFQTKALRNSKYSDVKNPKFVVPCGITPLRAVVDYDGTFYPCPFFHSQKGTAIGKGKLSKWWGKDKHKKAISNIKNCNQYDCPFAEIDWKPLNEAHLNFI